MGSFALASWPEGEGRSRPRGNFLEQVCAGWPYRDNKLFRHESYNPRVTLFAALEGHPRRILAPKKTLIIFWVIFSFRRVIEAQSVS